ncbi:dehydrogenase/reductase SDR family member 1-like [Liolophura sinensis]|uniref:dehydrogenase/reductase SDR family member 1-like n=1 Tax=Liolophura sinensis TaxID=3198878 RepID=UPI00315983B1
MAAPKAMCGKVCIVTGASRGIGRGIALQLGEAGAVVYITGRTLETSSGDKTRGSLKATAREIEARGGQCIPVQCDHSKDVDIEKLFEKVKREQDGRLDVLVNNAYSGVKTLMDNYGKPFWEQPATVWDEVNNVGLRNHYICTVQAARLMVPRKQGLIVNISSAGGIGYFVSPVYGIGKEACDRMAADCAVELRKHNVACVSLWPGAVRTEHIQDIFSAEQAFLKVPEDGFLNSKDYTKLRTMFMESAESVELSGKCIVKLATDPHLMKKSGRIFQTGQFAEENGLKDIDGSTPSSLFRLSNILRTGGYTRLAAWVPNFVKVPRFVIWLSGNKL